MEKAASDANKALSLTEAMKILNTRFNLGMVVGEDVSRADAFELFVRLEVATRGDVRTEHERHS